MGIKALENLVGCWYTPEGQDDETTTRFKCRPLDGEQYGNVVGHFSRGENGGLTISGEGHKICLRYGLEDWENFNNANGEVKCFAANHRLIPFAVRNELVTHILEISSLSGEQEKN